MTSIINLYDLFNLSSDCSVEEIKKKYIEIAKESHPDCLRGYKERLEMFELLTYAYTILTDPVSRKEYDEKIIASTIAKSSDSNLKNYPKKINNHNYIQNDSLNVNNINEVLNNYFNFIENFVIEI